MGNMDGYRQVSLYIDSELYTRASHVAKMLGEPIYTFVNKALALAIEQRATAEQRKAVDTLTTGGRKNAGKSKNSSHPRK